jgi:hypothetical protein
MGIPSDRSDRQMSVFADAATIQAQMASGGAGKKKRAAAAAAAGPGSAVDWKAYNRDKKARKLQAAKEALLADE